MADQADDGGDDIFVYVGGRAPRDVRRAKIDESIDTIPRGAFYGCGELIEVVGHNKLKKVEKYAFYYCNRLRRVTKMGGVKEIEYHAFFHCVSLTNLEFDKLEIIGGSVFPFCKSLRSINMTSVTRVGEHAFQGCEQLSEATFGEDLERIEGSAFLDCPFIRRISIPLKDNLIAGAGGPMNAFSRCHNLSKVDIVGGIHKTISSLHMETWRDEMMEEIESINQTLAEITINQTSWITLEDGKTVAIQQWIRSVINRMEHYKAEHQILLKEATTLLELALWKAHLDENNGTQEGVRVTRGQAKRARKERCITSGAGIIIKNVLPFLELDE